MDNVLTTLIQCYCFDTVDWVTSSPK